MYGDDTVPETASEFDQFKFPIERMEGESVKAFDACICYIKLPPNERSVLKAFKVRTGRSDAKQATSSWKDWSKQFDWKGRAERYDLWNIRATTQMIVDVQRDSISDVRNYFNALNAFVIRDANINIRLFGFLENAMDEKDKLAHAGRPLAPHEIKALAEARLCIITGTQKAHAIALDLLGYSSLPVDTKAEVIPDVA